MTPASPGVRREIEHPEADLHVPVLCDVEVASALQGLLLGNRIAEDRAMDALADYIDLPLTRHGHPGLLGRMLRQTLSAYDAAYVALAEHLDAVLLTADRRIADALRATGSSMETRP